MDKRCRDEVEVYYGRDRYRRLTLKTLGKFMDPPTVRLYGSQWSLNNTGHMPSFWRCNISPEVSAALWEEFLKVSPKKALVSIGVGEGGEILTINGTEIGL